MASKMTYECVSTRTMYSTVALFERLRVPLAGISSTRLYRAICKEAVQPGSRVVLVLCLADDVPVGFFLAVRDLPRFWKEFALRHPLCTLEIAAKRILGTFSRPRRSESEPAAPVARVESLLEAEPPRFHWSESGPGIAKILYGAMAPEFQNGRFGYRTFAAALEALEQRGVTRLDARASIDNSAAIRLHAAFGFRIYADGTDVLSVRLGEDLKKR